MCIFYVFVLRNHRVLLEPAQHVTRFIGLAPVENSEKQKWLYAFTITPMHQISKEERVHQPSNSSEFPYMEILEEFITRRMNEQREAIGDQYFYDMAADPSEDVQPCNNRRRRNQDNSYGGDKRQRKQNIQPDTCWFCLSNTSVERHLIVSIGNTCYTAMPRGPLNNEHLLVMSIGTSFLK